MTTVHRYRVRVAWRGSTAAGYGAYPREHDLTLLDAAGTPLAAGGTAAPGTRATAPDTPSPAAPGTSAPRAATGEPRTTMRASADPAFLGRAAHPNPEQLVLAAAASCQLLSFLAVAARARLDVVAYEDDATAEMDEADPPLRLTAIALRPRITLGADGRDATDDRLAKLAETAHRECFVARSLATPVTVVTTVQRTG